MKGSGFMQVNDAIWEAVEGDPRNVLCDAVDKHNASVLVVGSHGYGAIKRYRFPIPTSKRLKQRFLYLLIMCFFS